MVFLEKKSRRVGSLYVKYYFKEVERKEEGLLKGLRKKKNREKEE